MPKDDRIARTLASVASGDSFEARLRAYRTAPWWFIGVGVLVAVGTAFMPWSLRALLWPLAVVYAGIGVYVRIGRLTIRNGRISITAGPIRHSVDLERLTQVTYRRPGRGRRSVANIVLEDLTGQRLKISVGGFGFARDDEWAAIILHAAERARAVVEPKARNCLVHLDGTGRGYLA